MGPDSYIAAPLLRVADRVIPTDPASTWRSTDLIASRMDGSPPAMATNELAHPNTISHRWRMTRQKAGLEGLRLHDLRHFCVGGLIAQGRDVVTVQRALGDASATVTLGTYSHLWPTAEDRTRKAAEAILLEGSKLVLPRTPRGCEPLTDG